MLVVEAKSASEMWSAAWNAVTRTGVHRHHPRGDYVDCLHSILSLSDPRQRWTESRSPVVNPAFALAEVIWIMRGRSDLNFLTTWNKSLVKFTGESDHLHGAYGERVRNRFGFDQLQRAAEALTSNPTQRQVVLQIWDASTDFPTRDGRSRDPDIPCNVTSLLKVSDGRLEWMQVMRSNDLVMGLPYNIIQWTTVQEILAGWVSLDVGSYVHVADSLHVYDRDRNRFTDARSAGLAQSTDLRLGKDASDALFAELAEVAEALGNERSPRALTEIAAAVSTPGYSDWPLVLAAERLRRLGARDEASDMLFGIRDDQLRRISIKWHKEKIANT